MNNKDLKDGTTADSSTAAEDLTSSQTIAKPIVVCQGGEEKLYRFVKVSERKPTKFGMYICHVKVQDDGLTFLPVSYCQFDTIKNDWTNKSVCGTEGEVIDWLELVMQ